jgi:tetratricopeptide (TPR) repeat protein
MANEQPTLSTKEQLNESLGGAISFFDLHKNKIYAIIAVVLGGIFLFYAYTVWYKGPKEKAAQVEIYKAQRFFERDSFSLAYNGNGQFMGFKDIMNEYSGTKAGNLSQYYAAVCLVQMGQKDEALPLLESYSANDNITQGLAYGLIADIKSEKKEEAAQAVELYKKAANTAKNGAISSIFLVKAAALYEELNDKENAKKMYEQVIKEYPKEAEIMQVEDKDLPRVGGQ